MNNEKITGYDEISYTEFIEMLDNDESFVLLIGSADCAHCIAFKPTITKFVKDYQLDVKYIPKQCYVGDKPDKFYQYTVIDEASRERFIYPYREQSSYSTIDFIKRTISNNLKPFITMLRKSKMFSVIT